MDFERTYYDLLMSYSKDGNKFWPVIRFKLFITLMTHSLKLETPHKSHSDNLKFNMNLIFSLLRTFLRYNPFFVGRNFRYVIFSNASLRRSLKSIGYKNILYDYLVDLLAINEETLFIEQMHNWKHYFPVYSQNITFEDIIDLKALIYGRIFTMNENSFKEYELLIQSSLQNYFQKDFEIPFSIVKRLRFAFRFKKYIEKILNKIKPKLAFVHLASYGGPYAYLVKSCKELGIKVFEYQHGVVDRFHLAYNYPAIKSDYLDYLPDVFLTFGPYWSLLLTNYPVKKIDIGSPHLEFEKTQVVK